MAMFELYITVYSYNCIPISAFKLFIDQPMLQTIRNHTVAHRKIDEPLYDASVNELYAFIGLQLACGILVGKNTSISDLWNKQWGPPIFSKTMTDSNRLCNICVLIQGEHDDNVYYMIKFVSFPKHGMHSIQTVNNAMFRTAI